MMTIIRWLIRWLINNATFRIYTSDRPIGVRLGGHDDSSLPDRFIIIEITVAGQIVLLGYFQTD
jgi:hypothetical protein